LKAVHHIVVSIAATRRFRHGKKHRFQHAW
jgi:hypothetical protein